jgi:hypothetical protein
MTTWGREETKKKEKRQKNQGSRILQAFENKHILQLKMAM